MGWIVVARNPGTKRLIVMKSDEHQVAEFETDQEARDAADAIHVFRAWDYQIVEID